MINKEELKNIVDLVHAFLRDDPETRSSDSVLYYKILDVYGKRKGIDIESMPIPCFFLQMAGEFPNYESVRRSRQKIQAKYPELSANKNVKQFRDENEAVFREFAVDE